MRASPTLPRAALADHKVDAKKPTLQTARVIASTITLIYDEDLNTTAPAASAFSISIDGETGSNPSAVSISGRDVTLTLATTTTIGQTVTVSYTKPTTNPIKDPRGNEADAFADREAVSHTPPAFANATETLTVLENATPGTTVGTVAATDPDGDTVTYSLSGRDRIPFRSDFSLDTATGTITVRPGATVNYEVRSSYSVMISATDGENASGEAETTATSDDTVSVTINVTNVDEVGAVLLPHTSPRVGKAYAASLRDVDNGLSGVTWQWLSADTADGPFTVISGAASASYTPKSADEGKYLKAKASYSDGHGPGKSEERVSNGVVAPPLGPNPTAPGLPSNLQVISKDRALALSWGTPDDEDERAPVTAYRVRYRQVGSSSWRNVSRSSGSLSTIQTITGLTNRRAYQVQVAAVNRIGTGAWASGPGTPQAPPPPPEPEGDETFNVGRLGAYWADPDANGNTLQKESCTGSEGFRVIWAGPDDHDRRDIEWDAHIVTRGGAGRVSHTFRETSGSPGYFEMNGTVRMEGDSSLSIRVRGRYGATWGTWSPPVGLYCFEPEEED